MGILSGDVIWNKYVNGCDNLFQPVDIEDVAETLLGNTTYVGWPHLFEAKVVQVSNDTDR